jgi:hypothetical protein
MLCKGVTALCATLSQTQRLMAMGCAKVQLVAQDHRGPPASHAAVPSYLYILAASPIENSFERLSLLPAKDSIVFALWEIVSF